MAKIEATKIAELRRIAADSNRAIVLAHIEATVLWASSVSNRIAVEDESGSALIELDHHDHPLKAGQKISVRGLCLAENRRLRFGSSVVVDNDGPHPATEQSGSIFLSAGKHPIRVGYYDGGYNCALTVEYEGPGIPRQIVPEKALFHSTLGRDGGPYLERGVNYRCFVGTWLAVPDFSSLTPTKIGVATNFDFNIRERGTNIAILYTGWIDAPHAGLYTFYTTSDDGSLLWIGDPTISMNVLGDGPAPSATTLNVATLKIGEAALATVEGVVSFARVGAGGQLELRIESGTNQINAVVESGAPFAPVFSHVRARGVAHRLRSTPAEPTRVEMLIASGADFEIVSKPAQKNSPLAKNIADLRRLSTSLTTATLPARLDGTVLAANADGSTVILQDETAITLLELDPREKSETAGRRIRIDGPITVARNRLSARAAALIDNDGIHAKEEKSASVYLRKGKHPFEVAWFNMLGGSALEVSYEGPGFARRPIESSVLSHAAFNAGKRSLEFEPGLEVGVHEGVFSRAAEIFNFTPIKTGIWETISLAAATRNEKVALDFRGFIDIPRDGHYVFHVASDDGSLLYVNQSSPTIEIVGTAVVPSPREIAPRQWAPNDEQGFWASVEGVVSYIDAQEKSTDLELASSSGRIHIEVAEPLDVRPAAFMNCRVRVTGICETALTLDGQRIAGMLRTPSFRQVEIIQATPRIWTDHRVTPIRELLKNPAESGDDLARITAKVYHHGPNALAVAEDESGQIDLDVSRLGNIPDDVWINIIGRRVRKDSKDVLVGIASRTIADTEDLDALRLLTTIDEVKSLSRLEASRGYPVRARGVVTALMPEGFFLQDSTRSVYVEYNAEAGEEKPERGDCWEVEGTTFAMFAPNIRAKRAVRLGKGTLPEPLRPSWDQLIGGSLDTHYIEIEGVIVSADDQNVLLFTRGGKITVQPWGIDSGALKRAENGRVRLRGCYAPDRDEETQQVRYGQIYLYDASMSVDEPAPADPFSAPLKHASDLLRFDAQGGALQRVKVIGQILHQRDGEYFVYDKPSGLRFTSRYSRRDLKPGDVVELVGFPELGRSSPLIRAAIVRKIGSKALPPPRILNQDALLSGQHDSSLVQIEGSLIGSRVSGHELTMEIQAGPRAFIARVAGANPEAAEIPIGSKMRIAGVYAGKGGDRSAGRDIDAFELLVNSMQDVTVLQRPAWWSLQHTVTAFFTLGCTLLFAALWIKSLRERVKARTLQLEKQIEERKVAEAEAQRARIEAERAREVADAANLAKSQFLAAMSHEIRTPMNGVIGMTNLLLETGLNPEQHDFAETTRQSAESLLTVINDILDFSKIEAGKLDFEHIDFDLVETIESTVEFLAERAHSKNLELNLNVQREVPRFVRGDANRLRQILTNLIGNGIKFTALGEVFLNVKVLGQKEGRAQLHFSIKDTGIGIDTETRNRLFQPFSQADSSTTRRYGGTGLGLVISRRLIEMMDGEIHVESSPGQGSTFWFTATFEVAESGSWEIDSPSILEGKRVLIVDDNGTNRTILQYQLTGWKMVVDAAVATPSEALSKLRYAAKTTTPFDVVVLDMQMPEMDGVALASAIRAEPNLPQPRMVLLTSMCNRIVPEALQAAGIEAHLTKPVRPAQFQNALVRILGAPLASSPASQAAPLVSNLFATVKTASTRILLAEDNPVNQKVALRQLKKLGYEAHAVSNGREVLEALQRSRYHVILMDCQMPEVDGYEAARSLRSGGSNAWIIAMTANAMQGDREICLAAGMDDYITKPVRIAELEAALTRAFEERDITAPSK